MTERAFEIFFMRSAILLMISVFASFAIGGWLGYREGRRRNGI